MSGSTGFAERALAWLWRLALAAPLALLALVAAAAWAPAHAEERESAACREGESVVPELEAAGRMAGIREAAAKVPHGANKFFRIEKAGIAPSYLFGTMHLSDPRVLALAAPVTEAIAGSRSVVIETLDVLDEKAATFTVLAHPELTNLPAGKTLGDYLTPEEKRALEASLAGNGTPFQSIETLQPWFTAMNLLLPACEMQRELGGARALDVRLALDAKAAGKRLVGLESAMEQLATMASMSMDLQVANLLASVAIEDRVPDLFETMIELYVDGRIAEITPLTEALMPIEGMGGTVGRNYAEFEQRIVVDRNRRMAERLAPQLREGGAFVAVGALHLPGEEGLVELLGKEGYRLVPLG